MGERFWMDFPGRILLLLHLFKYHWIWRFCPGRQNLRPGQNWRNFGIEICVLLHVPHVRDGTDRHVFQFDAGAFTYLVIIKLVCKTLTLTGGSN